MVIKTQRYGAKTKREKKKSLQFQIDDESVLISQLGNRLSMAINSCLRDDCYLLLSSSQNIQLLYNNIFILIINDCHNVQFIKMKLLFCAFQWHLLLTMYLGFSTD